MPRLMISITPEEQEALRELAEKERRDGRRQAALLVREGLERTGILRPREPQKAVEYAQ